MLNRLPALLLLAACTTSPTSPPSAAEVKTLIDARYQLPEHHAVTLRTEDDGVVSWRREFDGVEVLSETRTALSLDGTWVTRFHRELKEPGPMRRDAIWKGFDARTTRLVYLPQWRSLAGEEDLVIDGYHLAIEQITPREIIYSNAYTGDLIRRDSRLLEAAMVAQTLLHGQVSLDVLPPNTYERGALYRDPARYTYQENVLTPLLDQGIQENQAWAPFTASANLKNDLHLGLMASWDYYWARHARRGTRNQPITTVDSGKDAGAANNITIVIAPSVTGITRVYTNGQGAVYFEQGPDWYEFIGLDTVGHEWSHDVFHSLTGAQNTGTMWGADPAINESNADLFGELIEAYERKALGLQTDEEPTWKLAEYIPQPYRDMCQPNLSKAPGRVEWSDDLNDPNNHLDVHVVAGPLNRAKCLMGRGMRPWGFGKDQELQSSLVPKGFPGLGAQKMGRLFYQTNEILRSFARPYSVAVLRTATLSAAELLHGKHSPEYKAVEDGYGVVKIGLPANRTPPTASLNNLAVSRHVPVVVNAQDPDGVAWVRFLIDGQYLGVATSAPWQWNMPSNMTDGAHVLTITVSDVFKNELTVNFSVTADSTGPATVVEDKSVPNHSAYFRDHKVYEVRATDPAGVRSIELFVDDSSRGVYLSTSVATFTVQYTTGGWHKLQARSIDHLGNVNLAPYEYFQVDMTAPAFTSGPTVASTQTEGEFTVSFCGSDLAGVREGYAGGTFVVPLNVSRSGDCFTQTLFVYGPGTFAFNAYLTDVWFNTGSRSGNATVAAIAPTMSTPAITNLASSGTATVTATYAAAASRFASKGIARATMQVCSTTGHCLPGLVVDPVPTAEQTGRSFAATGLQPGMSYTALVEITAKNGLKTSRSSAVFTVPGVPPTTPTCNAAVHSGTNVPSSFVINVNRTSGFVDFQYETYTVSDQMTLSCDGSGTINNQPYATTNCVATDGWDVSPHIPFNCPSGRIKVQVTPNCASTVDTKWDFMLGCGY